MTIPANIEWAKYVAFLRLLHEVPVKRSKNKPGVFLNLCQDYILPFDRERQFVGAYAFLSCIKTKIDSIPAVCVREYRDTRSLKLLLTVNKRLVDEGCDYLQDMKLGFEKVFNELRRTGFRKPSKPLQSGNKSVLSSVAR